MSDQEDPFPAQLGTLLRDRDEVRVYRCIRDLLANGLSLPRFLPGEGIPNRQDVTQYLAAWSRHAGLSEEECRGWLIEYCASILAPLSKRTPAAIRHSTKSNITYIYRAGVPFLCECEGNRFKARCSTDCPVHAEMMAAKLAPKPVESFVPVRAAPVPIVVRPVKEIYREQFQAALRLAREEAEKGTKPKGILELLDQHGFKTRTGRKWTHAILLSELTKSSTPPAEASPTASGSE
jgi:hypothetical protein